MANNKIDELQADLCELKNILNIAKRQRVKDLLNIEVRKVETVLSELHAAAAASPTEPTTTTTTASSKLAAASGSDAIKSQSVKRYEVELTNYAWDQSEKFVKIFVTLDGVQTIPVDDVVAEFTEKSLCLRINGLNNKNYKLIINNLLEKIDTSKSYQKVKTNMVAIYAKKSQEGRNWSHLTSVEKRIKDNKPDKMGKLGSSGNDDAKDPTSGLFNMMRELYQSGDDEMKRLISKAWVEGEEKRRTNVDTDEL